MAFKADENRMYLTVGSEEKFTKWLSENVSVEELLVVFPEWLTDIAKEYQDDYLNDAEIESLLAKTDFSLFEDESNEKVH